MYAKWEALDFTITFIENGGSEVTNIVAPYNSSISEPDNPIKEGFTFDGWYEDIELTVPFVFTNMPLNGKTLYAKWNEIIGTNYSVSFDIDIASYSDPASVLVAENSTVDEPTSANAKYVWYSDSNRTLLFDFNTLITSDITLYGKVFMKDLIISEYIEGSSNNKYIEIYNGTGQDVDLSDYQLILYANGSNTPTNTETLTGTLAHGQVVVYQNSSAALTLPIGVTGTSSAVANFNGDDAIALYKISTSTNVDVFGQIGFDPGSAWTVGSITTVNKTLVRKSTILSGDIDGTNSFDPSVQWNQFNQDVVSNLGSHTADISNP
jgi:uncharacterized repeat protein (TIGR02543 family)